MPLDTRPLEPDAVIELYKKDVDVSLLRDSMKLTVTERFKRLIEMQRLSDELQRAGSEARKPK